MPKIEVNVTHFPEQVTQPGRYTIQEVKLPQKTKHGDSIILIVTNIRGEERSLFVSYTSNTSDQTNLGRLVKVFSSNTDNWTKRQLDVTLEEDGNRRIEPVAT